MGGGYIRTIAYKNFLESNNHMVDLIQFPEDKFQARIWTYYQRALAHFHGREIRLFKKFADRSEKKIRKEKYDVVIGVDVPSSYVLTRDLGCLKLFSCDSLESDEICFSKKFGSLDRIHSIREMELDIFKHSDYVIFPWETSMDYVRKHIWEGKNFITLRFGCYPQKKTVPYFFPVSIVSLGSLWGHWTNKELLSYLTKKSQYPIHVYGRIKPAVKYHLNYRGFARSTDVLYDYQFGLATVTTDPGRFTSRLLNYLAYGLPSLSPEWNEINRDLKGVLPFNEDNFLDIIKEYSVRDKWEKLSKEAYEQSLKLDWRLTLKPLEKIIIAK